MIWIVGILNEKYEMTHFKVYKLINFSPDEDKWYVSNGSDLYLRHDCTHHGFMNSEFVYGDSDYDPFSGGGTYYKTAREAEDLIDRYNERYGSIGDQIFKQNGTDQSYKVGKWYNWNSNGKCPVHPETKVEVIVIDNLMDKIRHDYEIAKCLYWDKSPCPIVAFRVIEEYKEPRDYWIHKSTDFYTSNKPCESVVDRYIHVREVKE